MTPVYVDIHIHTSENPNSLVESYDCDTLVKNVKLIAGDHDFLLSLSDHNTINKVAYMSLATRIDNLIIGVELHIKKDADRPPYHCHMLLNIPVEETSIDRINSILDRLYPNKVVTPETESVPTIEDISNAFDQYDYLLLPHGGQSNNTFDMSISEGKRFDTTMERSIYYNQFDGFTARSNKGVEATQKYFKRLGINSFVNLLTCTDNYEPRRYPEPKAKGADSFMPTWMYASPTFEGLRLSLSEESRLSYSEKPPKTWGEYIDNVLLQNERVDINVKLTPGLNVVIGGSSSGKSLFVDTIYRKLRNDYTGNDYQDFNNGEVSIKNLSGMVPHYINQNFIVEVLKKSEKNIGDISMIAELFPADSEIDDTITLVMTDFHSHIQRMINSVSEIERIKERLSKIPLPQRLIIEKDHPQNLLKSFLPDEKTKDSVRFSSAEKTKYLSILDELERVFETNVFASKHSNEIEVLRTEIIRLANLSVFFDGVTAKIERCKSEMDAELLQDDQEIQDKASKRENLISTVAEYLKQKTIFDEELKCISEYNVSFSTKKIEVQGHLLSITNSFRLDMKTITDTINSLLKKESKIDSSQEIIPEMLFQKNFTRRGPQSINYKDFGDKLYEKIRDMNKKEYQIITDKGEDFEKLSPGWKSAVLLDLILGYDKDTAPVIIDQPEDNLAADYINTKLISLIKQMKKKKQIILVSHNATIPMLGDAQNVVLCRNIEGKIKIVSQPLEGYIESKSVVDYIAEITDGGKQSIKKRVKKYNLKSFRED